MKAQKYYITFGIAAVIALIAFMIIKHKENNSLPILSEEIAKENGVIIYKAFEEFEGYDQNGEVFNNESLKGKVQVANFFFTSCPVVCPKMTIETAKVYEALGANSDLLFVSYSIDPKRDTVEQLKEFATFHETDYTNWKFVNVGNESVYKLARNSYKIVAVKGNEVSNDFIHSELLTLVDKQMRVRAYYDSTNPEDIEKLIKDIKKLI